ncbi:protein EARLY FLOWERING 3-like [Gastrolobium bilobum]|uniref:protein EARLY FLOWERING 3-like n=1 Tax=Gastrolobium bilobum TaxID=150636 RepID=UPI002AAF1D07|nr:protein EARLY FLOWERING 3-like [Gastrolobium bilobum]
MMKRGKDDEKLVGPMFPRLHVNDTEKGGPRAPPRNKMALYEQFTIPSQRVNPITSSTSQGIERERSYIVPVHLPSQTRSRRAESYISHQSDGSNPDTSFAQIEQREKVDEGDFRVSVYVHSTIGQPNDQTLESFSGKKLTPMGTMSLGCSVAAQNGGDNDPAQFGLPLTDMRKDLRSESEGLLQVSRRRQRPVMSVKNISTGEIVDSLVKQAKVIPNQEDQECPVLNISRLQHADVCLQLEGIAGSKSNDIEHGDGLLGSTRDLDNGNTLVPRGCFRSKVNQTSPHEATNDTEYHGTRTGGQIQNGNLDESDDVSKISSEENLSSLKVSPDDVVGIIGQKHFWKARREIANQQRLFAVQVFELHRLIKVQQLIAESPDFLLEDDALLGKFPLKGSTPKSLSLEVVIEPQQQKLKRQDGSEKLNHKIERSAENAVGKTSFSSLKNASHLSDYTHSPKNPHQTNLAPDNKTGPWCFNQSPGHQWLVPVMSPSEGLVYKPYPVPGFSGTTYPLGGTFMNHHAYGIPSSHQVIVSPPYIPPSSHAYFPPYSVPVMNQSVSGPAVEKVNQFAAQGSHGQNGHSYVEGASFNTHNQSSSNLPVQRNGAILHVKKFKGSKKGELQGSRASSPGEMSQGTRAGKIAEGRDDHSLSLMTPLVSEGVLQSLENRQQSQVIKVVPHNPRSATESAARIFQSIQEERKQYDLV